MGKDRTSSQNPPDPKHPGGGDKASTVNYDPPGWGLWLLGTGGLAALALSLYGEILSYSLTVADSSYLILNARVESWQDLSRILTQPYLGRTALGYFRPVTTLVFTSIEALSSLEPFGYHLTNLLFYAASGTILYRLVARLEESESTGLIAAFLFLLHPINIQVVPAVTLGQEIYVTGFFLLSMYCLLRWVDGGARFGTGWQGLSALFFLLSIGAKESGLLALPVLVVLVLVRSPTGFGTLKTWRRTGIGLLPHGLMGFLYGIYWGWVTQFRPFLEGSGPWRGPILLGQPLWTLRRFLVGMLDQGLQYLTSVLSPFALMLQVMGWHPSPMDIPLMKSIAVLVLLSVLVLLVLEWRSAPPSSPFPGLREAGRITGILCLLVIFLLPLYEPLVLGPVEQAYRGQGYEIIQEIMPHRQNVSLDRYRHQAARLLLGSALLGVFLGLCLYAVGRYGRPRISPNHLLYVVWLAAPVAFYGLAKVFHFRNAYIGVPAVCALAAVYLRRGTRSAMSRFGFGKHSAGGRLSWPDAGWVGTAILFSLAVVTVSPFVQGLSEWDRIQARHGRFMDTLERSLRRIPPGSSVMVLRIPKWKTNTPRAAGLPRFPGIAAATPRIAPWIQLRFPDRKFTVIQTRSYNFLDQNCRCRFRVESRRLGSHFFHLIVHLEEPGA